MQCGATFRRWMEQPGLIHLLALLFFTKLLSYCGIRIIYPLAPFLEDDWDVSRSDFGIILAVSELAAAPAVFIAPLADKYNVNVVAILAWLSMAVSFLMLTLDLTEDDTASSNLTNNSNISPKAKENSSTSMFILVIFSRIIFAMGFQLFFTTSLSVIFGAVKRQDRPLAVSVTEYSWSFSAFLMIPVMNAIYGATNARITFLVLGLLMVVLTPDIMLKFPRKHLSAEDDCAAFTFKSLLADIKHKSVIAFNGQGLFFNLAHNGLLTFFSFWASDEFGVSVEGIGLSFFLIGISELMGSLVFGSIAIYYRKNLYIACYFATGLMIIALIGLVFTKTYAVALFLIFLAFFGGEIVVIFTISEVEVYVLPSNRNSMITLHSVCMFIGRSIGAFFGEKLYTDSGITTAAVCCAVSAGVSGIFLMLAAKWRRVDHGIFVKEFEEIPQKPDEGDVKSEFISEPIALS